ncbi:CLUMA_CG003383, isoform A [Clunio marinus]|uniref:CLUMA_CG003383, isoform A n=1 Tax=Clunio marinus TaxID=568069 RepID=A0A1J1HP90_9DIPT|nr:CLUMA_CG003383, isoform A [Clunio marinus]
MMLKMLITVFILLEIISFAKSGRDEFSHDSYAEKLENLATESINSQDALTSLQFQPKTLDFLQRSIGDPHNQVVILFNKHKHKKVYLGSITGSSSDFYSSFFEDKVIPPESNTTFKVVFLPRQLGETNSSFIIHTSFGAINYQVRGIGVECQYKLRPIIGIKLPLNATVSPEIQLYNPHDFALQISEIYSSGGDFQLELPNVSSSGQEGDYKLWEIPPYTSKPIIRVRFHGYRAGNHTAYVRIKIAGTSQMDEKMLVVPIEIEITNETGIYSQVPLLDFGTVGVNDGVRKYVYNLLNSGSTSISIKNWGVESVYESVKSSQCVNVDVVQFSRRNFTDHFTVEIDWSKCSNLPNVVSGHIFLTADQTIDDEVNEITYKIPFFGQVIDGNLGFKPYDLMFLRSDKKTYETSRSILVKNKYNVPLAITNLTVPESSSRYFKLTGFKPFVLQPGSFAKLLDIQPLSILQIFFNQTTLEESFRIVTNMTYYDIPITSYTGLLRRIVPVDFARERSQIDEKALNFGALLPVSKNSELLIAFVNENPIPIDIKDWRADITNGNGPAQITSLQRGCSKMSLDDLVFCNPVKPGEWIVFAISVKSSVVGSFTGNFWVKTQFEDIITPVKFSTAMGRLELKSKMIFDDCFPGKICSLNVQAYSTFMKKMYVEGIAVDMDGISYEFAVKGPNELPEILPNIDTDVGKLFFNPKDVLCKKRSTCYTSFDALSRPHGEAWMRTLTNFTAYSLWDNERMKNQLNSFMEVKQSLKQMQFRLTTSQIRRYEFNASINFVWPRLISGNVEFPFVQINKLETRFIEIYNPSNQLLYIHFVLHNVSQHGDKVTVLPEALRDCPNCLLSHESPFSFNSSINKEVFMDEVMPRSYLKVGIDLFATTPGTYSTLLYMRNNLTVVEAVWLSARAVVPQFKFGNRKPGNATPLQFEISEKHLKLCEKKSSAGANMLISSKRTFTAKNYGEVPLVISGMRVENDLCLGYGFKVLNCEPFQLMPNESKKIEIAFSPDFTLSRVVRTLNFDTSIGTSVNFTLIGTVASSALEMCSKNIQRPHWEPDFKRNALMVLWVALILVVLASAIDSDRILKEHMRIITREKGPIQPPLDLRQIGLEANSAIDGTTTTCFASTTNQERLNNLNNHQTSSSLNNIRKRLTMTKKNDVSSETFLNGRFNLNKEWSELRKKFMSTAKVTPSSNNEQQQQQPQATKTSPRPVRHDINKTKNHQDNNPKESKKVSIVSEDDSLSSSSSSKENCEVSSSKVIQHESPPLNKSKNNNSNSGKKSKVQLNVSEALKDQKNCSQTPKAVVKPLNTNQNQNKNQQTAKEVKINKVQTSNNNVTPSNAKINNGDLKSHSPTSNASSSEGNQQQNHHHGNNINEIIADTVGNDANCIAKNETQQPQQQRKYGKTSGRDKKNLLNTQQQQNATQNNCIHQNGINNINNNNNNNSKRGSSKDNNNKQFLYRQNMSSTFGNDRKLSNGHQNSYGGAGNNNWNQQPPTSAIWSSTSYSDVVAKPPIDNATSKTTTTANNFVGAMNGMVNGHKHQDHDLIRNSFNRDRYIMMDQDEGSQYGPIGTKKSPSSTPSWEPLSAGINHYSQLAKPSPFISNSTTSSNNLWSPAYRRNDSPTSPSSNWSSPSPPLAVPPGFEQKYQQPTNAQPQQTHQNHSAAVANTQVIPAYDPFKSLSVIWEPSRNERAADNEREPWNQ